MKQAVRWLVAVVFVVAITGAARAQERGTEADAKQMVEEALAHIKQVGTARAFEDFDAPGEKWQKKDIYIFCFKLDGTCTCHAAKTALVGKNLLDIKTPEGESFIKNMADLARAKGSGWVEYHWPHPQTGKLEAKRAYIVKIPGYDGFIGAGAYK